MSILNEICQAVIEGNIVAVKEFTEKAIAQGVPPERIFREALVSGMDEVGRRMEAEEYFIPEVLLSAHAMKTAVEVLKPLTLEIQMTKPLGKAVIGTVQGDLHDIGKNLVAMMLEGKGFEVIDLGVNVPPEQFIAKVKDTEAGILAMSALLTTTMPKLSETIQAFQDAGYRGNVIVIVGGAPISQEFAERIGADGFASDAGGAARLAEELVTQRMRA